MTKKFDVFIDPAWQAYDELRQVERTLHLLPTDERTLSRRGELSLRLVQRQLKTAFMMGISRLNPKYDALASSAKPVARLQHEYHVSFWGTALFHSLKHKRSEGYFGEHTWCLFELMRQLYREAAQSASPAHTSL